MESHKKSERIFLLLDLDNSLIDVHATKLNEAFLEVMDEFKITDVCFFSSMTKSQIKNDLNPATKNIFTRPAIKEALEKRGITVHKVMTPVDLVYKKEARPGIYYDKRWKPVYDEAEKIGFDDPNFNNTVALADKEMVEYQNEVIELEARLRTEGVDEQKIKKELAKYREHKGMMYKLALDHIDDISLDPNIIPGSFMAVDDLPGELQHIKEASEKRKDIPLTTLRILSHERDYDIHSDIDVGNDNDKERIKARYREQFIEHFEKLKLQGKLNNEQFKILKKAKETNRNYRETQNTVSNLAHAVIRETHDSEKQEKFLHLSKTYFNNDIIDSLSPEFRDRFTNLLNDFSSKKSHSINRFTGTLENELWHILSVEHSGKGKNYLKNLDEKFSLTPQDWQDIKTSFNKEKGSKRYYAIMLIETLNKLYEVQNYKTSIPISSNVIKEIEHKNFLANLPVLKMAEISLPQSLKSEKKSLLTSLGHFANTAVNKASRAVDRLKRKPEPPTYTFKK